MVTRSVFGNPIETDAVLTKPSAIAFQNGEIEKREDGFYYTMKDSDIVYGLGENVRGINKRGWKYISSCSDDPVHSEEKRSLYGAHNFILISGDKNIGIFAVAHKFPTILSTVFMMFTTSWMDMVLSEQAQRSSKLVSKVQINTFFFTNHSPFIFLIIYSIHVLFKVIHELSQNSYDAK